jgi:hypothetical protein
MKKQLNKSDIETILSIITDLASIEVIEKTEDEAVIFLEDYNRRYKLKKDDWSFMDALNIIFNIEVNGNYNKFYDNGNLEDIAVVSPYELLELREAIETDKKLFSSLYQKYFYEDIKYMVVKDKACNKDYMLDYINFIDRLVEEDQDNESKGA